MKPRIFIGSSTEGLAVAERIKNFFEPIYESLIPQHYNLTLFISF